MRWTWQCCLLEATWHLAGRGRYISYRWNTLQFPWKCQAVQECTGGYIPGKPVVSAPLYCRNYMYTVYMYVCIIILCINFCSHTLFVPPVAQDQDCILMQYDRNTTLVGFTLVTIIYSHMHHSDTITLIGN